MKNRTNSCKKWLAVLLSVSMLPTAILQNGSMAYAEEKKQEEAVTAEEALEDWEADIVVEEISISNKEEFLKYVQKTIITATAGFSTYRTISTCPAARLMAFRILREPSTETGIR